MFCLASLQSLYIFGEGLPLFKMLKIDSPLKQFYSLAICVSEKPDKQIEMV